MKGVERCGHRGITIGYSISTNIEANNEQHDR